MLHLVNRWLVSNKLDILLLKWKLIACFLVLSLISWLKHMPTMIWINKLSQWQRQVCLNHFGDKNYEIHRRSWSIVINTFCGWQLVTQSKFYLLQNEIFSIGALKSKLKRQWNFNSYSVVMDIWQNIPSLTCLQALEYKQSMAEQLK